MEKFQQLFDEGKYNEVIEQTSASCDYNALFLRARAYIAVGDWNNAIENFQTAVATSGVWGECLEPFNAFQKELGVHIATHMRSLLNKSYDDIGARRSADQKTKNFDLAANLVNTYKDILTMMKEAMTPICPMPSIMPAVGLPERSHACTVFIEDWVNTVEKMFSRALNRWDENADAILAEPDYRDATFGDIILGRIACNNIRILLSWTTKEEYAKNIPQCDRLIALLTCVLGAVINFDKGSMPLVSGRTDLREKLVTACKGLIEWRQSVEEGYTPPQIPPEPPVLSNKPSAPTQSSGGCYVATCVYGSYDCPQVWTLRRFRDNTLAETWYGRAFIKTYYAVSPTWVKWFGNTQWFKKLWQGKLDHMVAKLQANGIESTPYEDKEW